MNEPRVVESVTNECQSLGRAHESSSARAEQLIACLEGEIAKRDETIARLEPQLNRAIQANYDLREELAACRVAVENCEVFRARIAELENELSDIDFARRVSLQNESDLAETLNLLRAELAAIKAQEPVSFQYREITGEWKDFISARHYADTLADGAWPIRPLYAAQVSEAKRSAAEMFSDVLMCQRNQVETLAGDPYMVGLYNGMSMMIANFDDSPDFERLSVSEAKAQGVVMPERQSPDDEWHSVMKDRATGWNASLGEVARLNAAPAAPAADAWIPVSERLPAVESRLDQECRAGTLSIAPLNVSAAVLVFDGEKVRSTRLEWFDGCLPLPYCITHWMPLPAAPAANSAKGVV